MTCAASRRSTRSSPRTPASGPRGPPSPAVLKDAGLVQDIAEGTRRIYAADPAGIAEVRASVERLWRDALVALKHEAESSHEEKRR